MTNTFFARLFVGMLLLTGLSGCSTAPSSVSEEVAARVNRIGIVSIVAQELHRGYTGFTVFGNEYEKQDISTWKVDDEYEKQVADTVREIGKVPVIAEKDRKEFLGAHLPNGPYEAPAFNSPRWSAVTEVAKNYARQNNLDAVVIVVRQITGDFLAGTNQSIRGVGFYARGFGDATRVSALHLLGVVALIDGKTGQPLASTSIRVVDFVPPDISRRQLSQIESTEALETRARLIKLPQGYWERAVRDLFGR